MKCWRRLEYRLPALRFLRGILNPSHALKDGEELLYSFKYGFRTSRRVRTIVCRGMKSQRLPVATIANSDLKFLFFAFWRFHVDLENMVVVYLVNPALSSLVSPNCLNCFRCDVHNETFYSLLAG